MRIELELVSLTKTRCFYPNTSTSQSNPVISYWSLEPVFGNRNNNTNV